MINTHRMWCSNQEMIRSHLAFLADEPPVLLGGNQAPNAGEYLLHTLAGCLTGTIVYHAAARGIVLEGLECTLEGDLDLRA